MRFLSSSTYEPTGRPPTAAKMAAMGKLIEDAKREGRLLVTEGVRPRTQAVRRSRSCDGKITVTDGPFREAKEVLGGYALLAAASKKELLKHTKRFLELAGQGTCEIHPRSEMRGES